MLGVKRGLVQLDRRCGNVVFTVGFLIRRQCIFIHVDVLIEDLMLVLKRAALIRMVLGEELQLFLVTIGFMPTQQILFS